MNLGLIPRLVVRLRSAFPDASVECLGTERLRIVLGPQAPRVIEVHASPIDIGGEMFQAIQARMSLRFECLEDVSEVDYHRLVASENFGLRGVTVLSTEKELEVEGRSLVVRSSFVGLKGRTKDEAENALIDILSMVRFSRLLEDRILRSSAAGAFCFEMYQSQYLAKGGLRNRYINYARSVFQGSTERIFGEVTKTLAEDHLCTVGNKQPTEASITQNSTQLALEVRVPDEIPMLVFTSQIQVPSMEFRKLVMLANQWNEKFPLGHFEVGIDPRSGEPSLAFVQWKHLTNDLRLYAVDYVLKNLNAAVESVRAYSADVTKETREVREIATPRKSAAA